MHIAKGKAREDAHWQLGWWELYPLVDGPRKPVAWSKSSIIYTAHSTQPLIIARHFPSSRQFTLPLPAPVLESLSSFAPPTIITVSPTDDWLFAFIPSREGAGVGCLWRKGYQIDSWTATEPWTFPRGAGVVTAEWMVTDRPWVVGETGAPYRLPPRGPGLPMNAPTLLLVTQTHFLHLCALPPTYPTVMVARIPLLQSAVCRFGVTPPAPPGRPPSASGDPPITNPEDVSPTGTGDRRVCVHAAIGFPYNESTFCIAMRSKFLPSQNPLLASQTPGFDVDLNLQLDIASSNVSQSDSTSTEWERWGEDPMIDLCTVQSDYTGTMMILKASPLQPVLRPGSGITDLQFFAVPPDMAPPSPSITRDPRRPAKDGAVQEKSALYLAASFLNFDDYSTLPKSEVSLYSVSLVPPQNYENHTVTRFERTKTFDQGALAFLLPGPSKGTVLAGFLDTAGSTPRQSAKTREISMGSIAVLKLPDLTNDPRWESSPLVSSPDGIGRDIPTGVILSPNRALLCSISPSSPMSGTRTTIHSLPRRQVTPSQNLPPRTEISRFLVHSICSRNSPSDVVRVLTERSASSDTIVNALYSAAAVLDAFPVGLSEMWLDEILGVATEVYLAKAKASKTEAEKDALTEQWKTAHDICSVAALDSAFEDCKEDDTTYDLDAMWQLIGQTSWLVGLLEKILKQCIFAAEGNPSPKTHQLDALDVEPLSFADASTLLHLVHPYALRNLRAAVGHVERFRDQIEKAEPTTENAQLAKDALVDVVDSSGVNISTLLSLLDEIEKSLSLIPADESRRGLVSCSITPALRPFVHQAIDKVLASHVVNRTRLFIKPADLVNDIAKLSINNTVQRPWEQEEDVVAKGLLLKRAGGVNIVCVRCGGRSETNVDRRLTALTKLRLWRAWETLYSTRCVCGGAWARSNVI